MGEIRKAMILAAGLGQRARPMSLIRPKPLFPVLNVPSIARIMEMLRASGVEEIIINLHHLAPLASYYLTALDGFRTITLEEPEILGTGGGVHNAREHLTEPFFLINSDIYFEMDLRAAARDHFDANAAATLVMHDFPRFNQTSVHHDGLIKGFRLTDAPPDSRLLAFSGVHVIDPVIFSFMEPGPGDIITVYKKMISRGLRVRAHRPRNFVWRDFGTPESYLELHSFLLGDRVMIHPEAAVEDGADIRGWACLAKGATVESGAIVENSVIWPGARVCAGVRVGNSILTDGSLADRDIADQVLTGPPVRRDILL